jgi:hypothetical protein
VSDYRSLLATLANAVDMIEAGDPPSPDSQWVRRTKVLIQQCEERGAGVDYRALLVKYLAYRFANDVIPDNPPTMPVLECDRRRFTDAEWAELQRLAGEAGR